MFQKTHDITAARRILLKPITAIVDVTTPGWPYARNKGRKLEPMAYKN